MAQNEFIIDVENLRTFAKDMRKLGKDANRDLTKSIRDIVKPIAADIRGRIRETRQRHVKGTKSANSAVMYGVNGDGSGWVGYNRNNKYIGWLDFGGTLKATRPQAGHKRGRPNFQDRSPYRSSRYMYPAIEAALPRTHAMIVHEFSRMWEQYTADTNGR